MAISLLHWWGLDPHLDEQLDVMATDLDIHSLAPAAAAVQSRTSSFPLSCGIVALCTQDVKQCCYS